MLQLVVSRSDVWRGDPVFQPRLADDLRLKPPAAASKAALSFSSVVWRARKLYLMLVC